MHKELNHKLFNITPLVTSNSAGVANSAKDLGQGVCKHHVVLVTVVVLML